MGRELVYFLIIVFIITTVLSTKTTTLSTKETWWDYSFPYRQKINLSVTSGSTVQNYQVNIILNSINDGTNFNWLRNCNDIRFVNDSNNAELSYWIEYCNSANASIWVKID